MCSYSAFPNLDHKEKSSMLKYIAANGIALSVLYLLSEIGVDVFGNMLKTQRETKISIETQVTNAIKEKV